MENSDQTPPLDPVAQQSLAALAAAWYGEQESLGKPTSPTFSLLELLLGAPNDKLSAPSGAPPNNQPN